MKKLISGLVFVAAVIAYGIYRDGNADNAILILSGLAVIGVFVFALLLAVGLGGAWLMRSRRSNVEHVLADMRRQRQLAGLPKNSLDAPEAPDVITRRHEPVYFGSGAGLTPEQSSQALQDAKQGRW